MSKQNDIRNRIKNFCETYDLSVPIILAHMAGACPPALSIVVVNSGGMGGCGAVMMTAEQIQTWVKTVRTATNGSFQMNLWIPDETPVRNLELEAQMRNYLADWGPSLSDEAGETRPIDFETQCHALIEVGPHVMSSIMGLYSKTIVERMRENNIKWFATVTTVEEALAAETAGADAIVVQGAEAGGHRGAFNPDKAMRQSIGLFSLLPAVVDAVQIPVIATGGISDGRTIAATFILGASAVQIGTGFLRTPEANIPSAWAAEIAKTKPEDTLLTRAFSGRPGRSITTDYALSMESEEAPRPAPYPVQRSLTAPMRARAMKENNVAAMSAWAGQSAKLAQAKPVGDIVSELWTETQDILF